MQPSKPAPSKQIALLQVFSFTMLVVLLAFVGATTRPRPNEHPIDYSFVLLAGGLPLLGSAFLTVQKLLPDPETDPMKFQTTMLICLALAEFGTILSFVFHTSSGTPIWPLAIGTVAVNVGLILPRVLLYWQNRESAG